MTEYPARKTHRHFTNDRYLRINELIQEVRGGHRDAANELLQLIQPWVDATARRLEKKIFVKGTQDADKVADAVTESLLSGLDGLMGTGVDSWSRLNRRIQQNMRRNFEALEGKAQWEDGVEVEPLSWRRKMKLEAPARDEGARLDIEEGFEAMLQGLRPRSREMLLMHEFGGKTYEEIGEHFKVSKARAAQICDAAKNRIRMFKVHHPAIEEWMDATAERPLARIKRNEAITATEAQRLKNKHVEAGLDRGAMMSAKRDIFSLLCTGYNQSHDYLPMYTVNRAIGVGEANIKALTDIWATDFTALRDALTPGVVEKFAQGLAKCKVSPEGIANFHKAVETLRGVLKDYAAKGGTFPPQQQASATR